MSRYVWIAGPIRYFEGNYKAFNMAWEFVGEDNQQHLQRWRLQYNAMERRFTIKKMSADDGDQAHISVIRDVYKHIAHRDLPNGAIVDTLKGLLPAKEIAFATSLSILGRRHG